MSVFVPAVSPMSRSAIEHQATGILRAHYPSRLSRRDDHG
jgi:hypothetical protein